MLLRLGRTEEARGEFATAAVLAGNDREQALLLAKARGEQPDGTDAAPGHTTAPAG